MRRILYWCKSNPVGVLLIVVAVASIGVLMVVHVKGAALKEDLQRRYAQTSRQIESLARTPVDIPPEKPDGQVRVVHIPVDQKAIRDLQQVYSTLDQEYTKIFEYAMTVNRGEVFEHLPMLEGLFPDPIDAAKPFDARYMYREAFKEMLSGASRAPTYPRLNAGMPPTAAQLSEAMARVEQEFLQNIYPPKQLSELTPREQTDLHELKRKAIIKLYTDRASQLSVYAVTDINSPNTPFDIGKWSDPTAAVGGRRPEMEHIWEGQMGLWIQQDIVAAIALTNRVGESGFNVMNAPVKRLHLIRVVPGYVGIDTAGAILADGPAATTGEYASAAAERDRIAQAAASGEVSLPSDFSKAPTGRRSNTMYDVRHAWLVMDVDVQYLPDFFDNLSKVNFLTVLKMKIESVDEYKMLQEGFVYGHGDSVKVTMLIESIWLRDWTRHLMPRRVKEHLGLVRPQE